jgi:hypothetical protein
MPLILVVARLTKKAVSVVTVMVTVLVTTTGLLKGCQMMMFVWWLHLEYCTNASALVFVSIVRNRYVFA